MSVDASTQNSSTNALGTVLGYVGAEAATMSTFTRLLWPQRTYHRCDVQQLLKLALLVKGRGVQTNNHRSELHIDSSDVEDGFKTGYGIGNRLRGAPRIH